MTDFDDGNGWAEVQVKKKVKAQAKAVLVKHEDDLVAQENKRKIQEMKELYKDKSGTKKPAATKEQDKRKPLTPVKKTKPPEQKPAPVAQKPKFKDIEHALRALNASDFHLTLESVRANFNANHLILLRAITSYLNEHIRLTSDSQPTYSSKSNFYPSDVIPPAVRKDILTVIRDAGPSNYQYFFDMCLSSLADDMNKGLRYLGYKVILQQIAKQEPSVCGNSLARSVMLLNSYQNKPQIGLTILWVLGQGGFSNLSVGLKVWHDIMLPLLDSKHYSSFVGDYLYRILKNYSMSPYKVFITYEDFQKVYNLLTTTKKIPKPMVEKIALLYTEMFARNVPNPQKTFIQLLEKVGDFKEPNYIRHCILWCINRDINCLTVWKLNFECLVGDSLDLLQYLDQNFKTLAASVVKNEIFKDFLVDVSQLDGLEELEKVDDREQGTTKTIIKVSR